MDELEHEIAIYYDGDGNRREIRAVDLANAAVLERARQLKLEDEAGQIALSPRIITGRRPHFFAPSPSIGRQVLLGEKNPAHDQRVQRNIDALNSNPKWRIVINKYGEPNPDELFELRTYMWGKETHRIVSQDTIVRHDIFGQSPAIEMSIFRPWVAIEVINTHFPEAKAFDAFIELSQRIPFLVMFDMTAKPNYFLKIDPESGSIRPTFYIHDGSVWHSGKKTDIRSSASLASAMGRYIKP